MCLPFHSLSPHTMSLILTLLSLSICAICIVRSDLSLSLSDFLSHCYRFIDSNQHLTASLDKLVKNLKSKGEEHFKYTKLFAETDVKLTMLTRKGVYPYSYIDSWQKFEEGKKEPFLIRPSLTTVFQLFHPSLHFSTISPKKSLVKEIMTLYSKS